jgi:uncharacterized protein (DUF2252 family)
VSSVEERLAAGKALRKATPRAAHAELVPAQRRARDVVAVLREQARSRLAPLVPVRHARMLSSPFAFLRGAAAIMAADLAGTPRTGARVQACGDMHLANFGVYASAERCLVFGINDFDESHPGAWEWDLKRLVASAVVAQRHVGASCAQQRRAAHAAASAYRDQMREYARLGHLDLWYARIDDAALLARLSPEVRARAKQVLAKARTRGHLQVLDKMTELVDNHQRILEQRPLIVRATHTSKGRPIGDAMTRVLQAYLATLAPERRTLLQRYRIVDVAQKVVGVGSVGTRCWVIFLLGNSGDDPLFLQLKEARPSVLAPYFDAPAALPNHGQRVVIGQRLTQGSPDIFLGWGELDGVHFYVRQLRDMKGGAQFEPDVTQPAHLIEYAGLCGWALALAHAKSGDAALIAGYMGKSDELADALVDFAEGYADLTERDHATMQRAARQGKLPVAQIR